MLSAKHLSKALRHYDWQGLQTWAVAFSSDKWCPSYSLIDSSMYRACLSGISPSLLLSSCHVTDILDTSLAVVVGCALLRICIARSAMHILVPLSISVVSLGFRRSVVLPNSDWVFVALMLYSVLYLSLARCMYCGFTVFCPCRIITYVHNCLDVFVACMLCTVA